MKKVLLITWLGKDLHNNILVSKWVVRRGDDFLWDVNWKGSTEKVLGTPSPPN
jgi:hypothetical protein